VIVALYRAALPYGCRSFVCGGWKPLTLPFLPVAVDRSPWGTIFDVRLWQRPLGQALRNASSASANRLRVLRHDADMSPKDARKQADFLRALNETEPHAVVKRVETRKYASNDSVLQEYAKALVSVMSKTGDGQLGDGRQTFQQQRQQQQQQDQQDQQFYGQNQDMAGHRQAPPSDVAMALNRGRKEPIVVAMTESSFKNQVWSTIRMMAVAYVLLLGVTTFMEEQGLSRTATQQHDVTKASHSTKTFSDVVGVDEVC